MYRLYTSELKPNMWFRSDVYIDPYNKILIKEHTIGSEIIDKLKLWHIEYVYTKIEPEIKEIED